MQIAGVREFRGLYLPLEDASRVPADLRRELASVLGAHLAHRLEVRGVREETIEKGFRAHRRHRR